MRKKKVYFLKEGYEKFLNKFNVLVPMGTKEKPIWQHFIGTDYPIYNGFTKTLYYKKTEMLFGHGNFQFDGFNDFTKRTEYYLRDWKYCYMIDPNEGEEAILLDINEVNFIYNTSEYERNLKLVKSNGRF